MSATPAPTGITASPAAGQGIPSVAPSASRAGGRKRSVATSRAFVDVLDTPALYPARRGRDGATSSTNGDSGYDFALLSHPKDLGQAFQGVHQMAAHHHPKQDKDSTLPSGKGSPLHQRPVKLTRRKEMHNGSRRKVASIWDVIGHFLSRYFLIFVVGAGLGSTLWNWKGHPQVLDSAGIVSSTEVQKLEEFVSKTVKWMQVQLEVVNMRLGQEVGDLRKELQHDIELWHLHLDNEVKNAKGSLQKVGSSLEAILKNGGPLTKKEALVLIKQVVDKRGAEGGGKSFSLDDVRAAARQIVSRELERHSADGIGRADYALGSGGGRVIDHSEEYHLGKRAHWWKAINIFPGASRRRTLSGKILQPSFGEPGQCFPLKGNNVWVDIALRTAIYPDSISLEHASKEVAYDVSSSPKDFRVFGWRESRGRSDRLQSPVTVRPLGEFTFDIEKPGVQTFRLTQEDVAGYLVNVIRLHVSSNYGNPDHTCIYRVRVHGSDPAVSPVPRILD